MIKTKTKNKEITIDDLKKTIDSLAVAVLNGFKKQRKGLKTRKRRPMIKLAN